MPTLPLPLEIFNRFLIGSFFGGFFSWLFGSNEGEAGESNLQSDDDIYSSEPNSSDEDDYDATDTNSI